MVVTIQQGEFGFDLSLDAVQDLTGADEATLLVRGPDHVESEIDLTAELPGSGTTITHEVQSTEFQAAGEYRVVLRVHKPGPPAQELRSPPAAVVVQRTQQVAP